MSLAGVWKSVFSPLSDPEKRGIRFWIAAILRQFLPDTNASLLAFRAAPEANFMSQLRVLWLYNSSKALQPYFLIQTIPRLKSNALLVATARRCELGFKSYATLDANVLVPSKLACTQGAMKSSYAVALAGIPQHALAEGAACHAGAGPAT